MTPRRPPPPMSPEQQAERRLNSGRKLRQDAMDRVTTTEWAQIEKRLAEMPFSMRYRYLQAMTGKSLRAAVNSFCSECVGWVRDEVTKCTAPACPLYPYRPYQVGEETEE